MCFHILHDRKRMATLLQNYKFMSRILSDFHLYDTLFSHPALYIAEKKKDYWLVGKKSSLKTQKTVILHCSPLKKYMIILYLKVTVKRAKYSH